MRKSVSQNFLNVPHHFINLIKLSNVLKLIENYNFILIKRKELTTAKIINDRYLKTACFYSY